MKTYVRNSKHTQYTQIWITQLYKNIALRSLSSKNVAKIYSNEIIIAESDSLLHQTWDETHEVSQWECNDVSRSISIKFNKNKNACIIPCDELTEFLIKSCLQSRIFLSRPIQNQFPIYLIVITFIENHSNH